MIIGIHQILSRFSFNYHDKRKMIHMNDLYSCMFLGRKNYSYTWFITCDV